jgi:hypothetical protein
VIRILSLGAGVQSTTLSLMAARGEIGPMPDAAIFADTGWEPRHVYEHLNWLEAQLPFPIHRVSQGNLRQDQIDGSKPSSGRIAAVPWFMLKPNGEKAMGRRQCTSEYKLKPIQRKVVELMGGKRPRGGCEMWIGISSDEMIRMKESRVKYIVNRWPLVDRRMNRQACLKWMEERQYPKPPKSSCIGCPFHSDHQWRLLRDLDPEGWADAIEVDKAIRKQGKIKAQQFMHRSCVPLDQVDLSTAADRGQIEFGFLQECEGMCGV